MKDIFVNQIYHSVFEGYLCESDIYHSVFEGYLCESDISLCIWRVSLWIGYITLYLKGIFVNQIYNSVFEGYLCESDITLYLKDTFVNRIYNYVLEGYLCESDCESHLHIFLEWRYPTNFTFQKLILNMPLEIELDPFSLFDVY